MDTKHMHVSTWHLHLQINLKQILKDNYFYFEEISLSLIIIIIICEVNKNSN